MRPRAPALASGLALALAAAAACRPAAPPLRPQPPEMAAADTAEARRAFLANIDAIHKRDRPRYLASYLQGPTLARNGPGGLELGFEGWSARSDSTWPDTLIARDVRVVPVAPGAVKGSCRATRLRLPSAPLGACGRAPRSRLPTTLTLPRCSAPPSPPPR